MIQNPFDKVDLPPKQNIWFKFNEMVSEVSIKQFTQLLAYASDYNILMTAIQPHASVAAFANTQMASLDHAMWFHRIRHFQRLVFVQHRSGKQFKCKRSDDGKNI